MAWIQDVTESTPGNFYPGPGATEYYRQLKINNPSMYETVKQNDPAYIAEQQALADQQAQQALQDQIAASQGSNVLPTASAAPPPPPGYTGPSAFEKLNAVLPSGFEQTALPSSFASPFIESALSTGRGSAQNVIDTLLKRGTLPASGQAKGLSAITAQDPNVRGRLTDISNVLLENERAKLRGIAGQGYTAAQGQSGEFFDPSTYQQQVQSELGQFQQAFPSSYTSAAGDVGSLYNLGGLPRAAGAVTGPQNLQYDPYAVEGGKLSTGLESQGAPAGAKKRTTAVF